MNKAILATLITFALVGCGSNEDSSSTPTPPITTTVTGVAATGAPIYGEITVVDSADNILEYAATDGGKFEFKKEDIETPALIKAVGSAGGASYEIYSVILNEHEEVGVANITPLTQILISRITEKPASEVYSNFSAYQDQLTIEALEEAQKDLKRVLKPLLDGAQIAANFDLISSKFEANYKDIDAVLDLISASLSNTGAVLTYKGDSRYSVQLDWNESWDNKSFQLNGVELTPEKVKEPLTYVVAADTILESMVIQDNEQDYLSYVHDNAFWYGKAKDGMFAQLKSILPNETDPMNRYRDFAIKEVASDDSYLLAYTECYQDSPFATCGRAKAWFAKNVEGDIKFMGRKDTLPINVSAIIKVGFFNPNDRSQGNWAIEIDAFPDSNTICGSIPAEFNNTSWFAGTPKLVSMSEYMDIDSVTITGDGIDGKINLDSIYKEVNDGKITGCHLVDSHYGYHNWNGDFIPYSLVIDGYQVDSAMNIRDNSVYNVSYKYTNGSADTHEEISIGKGKQSSDDMSKYIANLTNSRGDSGDFYMSWERESKLATDLDVWVREAGEFGTQRVSVPDGKTSVSSAEFGVIERATLVSFDEYGRSISVGYDIP